MYAQMVGGMVKDSAQAKRIADGILSRAIQKLEQAARRAPVVQPDQLPPDAAKRAMEELQTEVEKLRSALAECRDACPIPKPGASNEYAWMQSIGDPESVPAFVKSCFGAPAVPVPQGLFDAIEHGDETHRGWLKSALEAFFSGKPIPQEVSTAKHPPASAPVQLTEPVAFALEWTFNGEERGMRLYDDETHCRFDAESDGGVCHPLYTEQQVRELLATQALQPLTQDQIRHMAQQHDAEDLCGWSYRTGVQDAEKAHGIKIA
jgi:hypothetical protein